MKKHKYDFSGWATRNNLKCADGLTIRQDAFKECDGQTVPLVWGHQHDGPEHVLGHALLENKSDGVYAYCSLNESESGQAARQLVEHGDITSLSIYANNLRKRGNDVLHGVIREVSLVLAGANPGANIEAVMAHGDGEGEAFVYNYVAEDGLSLEHGEIGFADQKPSAEDDSLVHADSDDDDETVEDIINSMNEKQKNVLVSLVGRALAEKGDDEDDEEDDDSEKDEGGKENMKHNLFDDMSQRENKGTEEVLTHDLFMSIMADANRYGSVKASFLAHGIDQIDFLFPDEKNLNVPPDFISREMGWVSKVMAGVHHTPFSRIKSMFANITEDEARAKGYIKGNLKTAEVFGLLRRTTTPTTVYKKQEMDRDDVIDITEFDVIAWLKREMRMMLDEELARAFLIGDGRTAASQDKINEGNIRPIAYDADLFTIKRTITFPANATEDQKAKHFIRECVKARKNYRGRGEPTLFTTQDMLTMLRLIEDGIGHILYTSDAAIANALRVKEIIAVPVMEGVKGPYGGDLLGVIVNLNDYNVGADKGGAINMFDDFDIDYNKQKYLIETRCSGALTVPFSAITLEDATGATLPTYSKVTPVGTENPSVSGWYEFINGAYVPSQDETVLTRKTYYELDS